MRGLAGSHWIHMDDGEAWMMLWCEGFAKSWRWPKWTRSRRKYSIGIITFWFCWIFKPNQIQMLITFAYLLQIEWIFFLNSYKIMIFLDMHKYFNFFVEFILLFMIYSCLFRIDVRIANELFDEQAPSHSEQPEQGKHLLRSCWTHYFNYFILFAKFIMHACMFG